MLDSSYVPIPTTNAIHDTSRALNDHAEGQNDHAEGHRYEIISQDWWEMVLTSSFFF